MLVERERGTRLERTGPHGERNPVEDGLRFHGAVEPFDRTQGKLFERFERASVFGSDIRNQLNFGKSRMAPFHS